MIFCSLTIKTDLEVDARSGILAQAAPNIGPIIFDEISGADGRVRSMQWTARVEPSLGETSNSKYTLTISAIC
jgi:cellobiose dehydrogenase (acceptor)